MVQRVDPHIGLLHRGTEKHATIFIDPLREFELGCERSTTPRLAALAGLDEGEFTEGHELDRKWRVPKPMVGRRLSQEEAKRLLSKLR